MRREGIVTRKRGIVPRNSLRLKLLAVIASVIILSAAIVWLSVDYFALEYFTGLLDEYQVPKKSEVMDMFLESAHRGRIWQVFCRSRSESPWDSFSSRWCWDRCTR